MFMKKLNPTYLEFLNEDIGSIMTNIQSRNKTFISNGSGVYTPSHQFVQQVKNLKISIENEEDDEERDKLKKQLKEIERKIKGD